MAALNSKTAKIYVDGELRAEHKHGDNLAPTRMDLRIGHRLGSTHFFNGLMDEVAIFEKALDKDEIQEVMAGLVMAVGPASKLSTSWAFIKKSARRY